MSIEVLDWVLKEGNYRVILSCFLVFMVIPKAVLEFLVWGNRDKEVFYK